MATATVNPYTFIPIRRRTKPAAAQGGEARAKAAYVLHCSLTAQSEIAVPDSQAGDRHGFYRVGGAPAIPGSSIRGVVRSTYEALTDSCMVLDDNNFHARSKYKKPGLLEKRGGTYYLFEAERLRAKELSGDGRFSLGVGQRCDFRRISAESGCAIAKDVTPSADGVGIYLAANPMRGKRPKTRENTLSSPSVFVKSGDAPIEVERRYVECLEKNIDLYDNKQTAGDDKGDKQAAGRRYREAFARLESGEPGFLLPVWYLCEEGRFELAPSQVSRSVYAKTPKDFARELGLSPCESAEDCCPACSLFGFVANSAALASRVRFADAHLAGDESGFRYRLLPSLLNPKVSSLEFYLYNDYYPMRFAVEDDGTHLAGRKAYWHWGDRDPRTPRAGDELFSAQEFETAPRGARFDFDVFADGVSADELAKLAYALTLGGYWGESPLLHKIGHGKPAGLGSARIAVESIQKRTFGEDGYALSEVDVSQLPSKAEVEASFDGQALAAIKKICDPATVSKDKDISYPRRDGEIFTWFAKNRKVFDKEVGEIELLEVLRRNGEPGFWDRDTAPETPRGTAAAQGKGIIQLALEKNEKTQGLQVVKLGKKGKGVDDITCPHCGKFGSVDLAGYKLWLSDKEGKTWKCSKCH